jgi:hypothetical protein
LAQREITAYFSRLKCPKVISFEPIPLASSDALAANVATDLYDKTDLSHLGIGLF